MTDLRKKVIRLAHQKPHLRKLLLPLVKDASQAKTAAEEIDLWEVPEDRMEMAKRLGVNVNWAFSGIHGLILGGELRGSMSGQTRVNKKWLAAAAKERALRWVEFNGDTISIGC